ncbi:MAG: hypothetical protein MJE77_05635 [Proteobacteria bacterium]|nr:hypothetical protein [Pseudomonadota bacterium]
MASKSQYRADEKGAEISELLDTLERLLERSKTLYEQYFMGIQKVAPAQLHRDAERKIRELTQMQIRNTALRYRLSTLTQKFGVYNTYWRRTMREIEQGRYVRDIARVRRKAARRGEDLPEEIIASMPKRVRDRIRRDRDRLTRRADRGDARGGTDGEAYIDDEDTEEHDFAAAHIYDARPHVHQVDATLLDEDFDAMFDALTESAEAAVNRHAENGARGGRGTAPDQPLPRRAQAVIYDSPPLPDAGDVSPDGPVNRLADRNTDPARADSASEPAAPGSPRPPRHFTPSSQEDSPNRHSVSALEHDDHTRPGWGFPPQPPPTRPPPPPAQPGSSNWQNTKVQWRPERGDPRHATTIGPRIGRRKSNVQASQTSSRPDNAPPPPGMTESQTQALYKRYMQARKLVGNSANVSYEHMVKTLRDQTSRIMQQHKATAVDYKVVIKNDKVILKAKPKR